MKNNLFYGARLLSVLVYSMLFLTPEMASGQCSPAPPAACNLSGSYYCTNIPNGQVKTVQQLINEGVLLPLLTAETTPQRVVVDGRVDFNQRYHFATGSELIFTENDSEFFITSPKGLVMRTTHVHGCNKLWNRIAVQGGRLDIEDCIIDLKYLEQNFRFNVKLLFTNNI